MPRNPPVNPELAKAREKSLQVRRDIRAVESDPLVRKTKWAALKEDFLERAAAGQEIHWPTLAAKFGFNAATVRNRASLEKWHQEIEIRRKAREDALDTKLVERSTMALEQLNNEMATNEANIRRRYAAMARGLQVKAIQRINTLKLEDLTARDALAMLKFGMDEERLALGMKEAAKAAPETTPGESEYQSVAEQMGGHRRLQAIGGVLLQALQGSDLAAELLREAGLGPVDVEAKEVRK